MVKIKICGIRRFEDIEIVNKYKPDYIGFVFADTKRYVSHELAYKLKQKLAPEIISVGVFVDEDKEKILKLFKNKTIKVAQLHGNESEEYIVELKKKTDYGLIIIKAIEMSEDTDLLDYDSSHADYLLLDSGKGSGKTFDWNLIKKDLKKDIFLAGGLNSEKVNQAIEEFNPYAIDLSSSLEVNGFKDETKIKEIMELIK